jgi:rubrerythrin
MMHLVTTATTPHENVDERELDISKSCDLNVVCPVCDIQMDQEHAHMRCPKCGYRDSCCF